MESGRRFGLVSLKSDNRRLTIRLLGEVHAPEEGLEAGVGA